jgi:hypothetical protein
VGSERKRDRSAVSLPVRATVHEAA